MRIYLYGLHQLRTSLHWRVTVWFVEIEVYMHNDTNLYNACNGRKQIWIDRYLYNSSQLICIYTSIDMHVN